MKPGYAIGLALVAVLAVSAAAFAQYGFDGCYDGRFDASCSQPDEIISDPTDATRAGRGASGPLSSTPRTRLGSGGYLEGALH